MNIDKFLDVENIVDTNIVEAFDCRFMGTINTFEYDINGKPFLVEKRFTRGEYALLACALNNKGETEDGNK